MYPIPRSNNTSQILTKSWDDDTESIPLLQLVDEHHNFKYVPPETKREKTTYQYAYHNYSKKLPMYIGRWGLDNVGLEYNVVAILGSQSAGKSTLLNYLFGTSFDVMEQMERQQTTKGIWLSHGKGTRVLVLDVEGSDGHEHGDDKDFERKSALFCMATCEVVILNFWEHQVGLYEGANFGTFRTVFEVNLELFQNRKGRGKTLLMVIIRDYTGNTPLDNLKEILQTNFERIWNELPKPERLEGCKIQDYFDFTYTGLPHKIFVPEQFAQKVAQLRHRQVAYNGKKDPDVRITAEDYYEYTFGIWEQIQKSKAIDLPPQEVLLARHRCNEIFNESFQVFSESVLCMKNTIYGTEEIIPNLGKQMERLRRETIESFEQKASQYREDVCQKKKTSLLTKLDRELHECFVGQLKNLRKKAVAKFNEDLKDELSKPLHSFDTAVKYCMKTSDGYFLSFAEATVVPETGWSYNSEHELLQEELRKEQHQREKEAQELVAFQARLREEQERCEREEQERRAMEARLQEERGQREQEHQERLAVQARLGDEQQESKRAEEERLYLEACLQRDQQLHKQEREEQLRMEDATRRIQGELDQKHRELIELQIRNRRSGFSLGRLVGFVGAAAAATVAIVTGQSELLAAIPAILSIPSTQQQ
ncbi:Dynamin-like GTPase that mediates homotypic ER fusion [Apophysomyces ossiformis]|uniref:Dynamin-like GTPase that mediates homotypic ER fusion n=1 Tax=Apophysomyces ossiformis TaxID=679940 RepID=A0A8H7EUV9_9FUNG|nr:Dynamin-like GTPase that mediates homotypic ER fusion [Apophysomyces ossiformis]